MNDESPVLAEIRLTFRELALLASLIEADVPPGIAGWASRFEIGDERDMGYTEAAMGLATRDLVSLESDATVMVPAVAAVLDTLCSAEWTFDVVGDIDLGSGPLMEVFGKAGGAVAATPNGVGGLTLRVGEGSVLLASIVARLIDEFVVSFPLDADAVKSADPDEVAGDSAGILALSLDRPGTQPEAVTWVRSSSGQYLGREERGSADLVEATDQDVRDAIHELCSPVIGQS